MQRARKLDLNASTLETGLEAFIGAAELYQRETRARIRANEARDSWCALQASKMLEMH